MNNYRKHLNAKIGMGSLKVWNVLLMLMVLWIAPMFMPSELIQKNILLIIIFFGILYIAVTKVMPRVTRNTNIDVILFERFCILLTFLAPTIYLLVNGAKNQTDIVVLAIAVFGAIAMVISIALHIKNAKKHYHGVKKTDLFE